MMKREDILGTWHSTLVMNLATGSVQQYARQTLIFNSDGTGVMKAKTLFGRTKNFTWEFSLGITTAYYDDTLFYIHDLGGPGAIATAMIEPTGELGVIEYPAGAQRGRLDQYQHMAMAMVYVR